MANRTFSATGDVRKLGASLSEYGEQLTTLVNNFGETVDMLVADGMSGKHQMQLANSFEEIAPSLRKYAAAMGTVGQGLVETAENTENTAETVAGGLHVV